MRKKLFLLISSAAILALTGCGRIEAGNHSSPTQESTSSTAKPTSEASKESTHSSEEPSSETPIQSPSETSPIEIPSSEETSSNNPIESESSNSQEEISSPVISPVDTTPVEEGDITVNFTGIGNIVMVSPKVKAYLDAMHEQEKTLEYPYRLSPLYGPEDYGAQGSDRADGYSGYTEAELGGVDVCDYLNRNDYNNTIENYPIHIEWNNENEGYTPTKIRYWAKEDKSDAREITVNSDLKSADLPNLYRNTEYKYQLILEGEDRKASQVLTFTTADYVRTITMGGVKNVRDLGGYMTSYGKRTKQGLIYRGYEIIDVSFSSHGANYTAAVEQANQDYMNIGVEIDLKDSSGRNGRTESCLQDAAYAPLEVVAYDSFLTSSVTLQNIPAIFDYLSKADENHVYFHCWGGADRTGMVAFFLNAILGVSYTDLIADFELTTETNNKRCHMHNSENAHFPKFLGAFTKYEHFDPSKTINENAVAFLTNTGKVPMETIEKIRSIMIEDYVPGMMEVEPVHTFDNTVWANDDSGHWHPETENGLVRGSYQRHNLVIDSEHSTPADCAHEGVEIKVCSICGKTIEKHTEKTGHTFVANGAATGVVHPEIDNGCNTHAYRLDIAEATGWHDPDTKWNAKNNDNAKAAWDISGGKIPAGHYELHLEAMMSYQSHSDRYFYNQSINGHTDSASQPDTPDESPFRYFFKIDGGNDINPTTEKNWGELGYTGKSGGSATPVFAMIIDELEIPEGASEFAAFHGNIGYSLIISRIRLVAKTA